MKVLIDIAHPAHIHYFRNFAKEFESKGHYCLFTLRDKGIILELAKYYNLKYKIRSKEHKCKIRYMASAMLNIYKIAKKFKPDIFIDMGTVVSAPISKLLRKPYIAFDDTEASSKARLLHMPFTDYILTPDSFYIDLGKKQIRFHSMMELMYLHPTYFSKKSDLLPEGLYDSKDIALIRFVSWEAHHDQGRKGLSLKSKVKLVEWLAKKYNVIISSEGTLPSKLKKHQYSLPPYLMHQLMAHTSLIITEGATMASEAVALGVPSIYINSIQNGYIKEEKEKGLLISLENDDDLYSYLNSISYNNTYKKIHSNYIREKINLTAFLIWFTENYPESAHIMKENPDYQYKFR